MNLSLHWIVERRRIDGAWEAVASKSRWAELVSGWATTPAHDRDPALIAALRAQQALHRSSVERVRFLLGIDPNGRPIPHVLPIARPGLLPDGSAYAMSSLRRAERDHGQLPGLGTITVGHLNLALAGSLDGSQENRRRIIAGEMKSMQGLMEATEPVLEILEGTSHDCDGLPHHAALERPSAHERLGRRLRRDLLEAPKPSTLRAIHHARLS